MDSNELANKIVSVQSTALVRVLKEGRDSYGDLGDERQSFEGETIFDILDEAENELLDLMNYAAMGAIRVRDMRRHLAQALQRKGT